MSGKSLHTGEEVTLTLKPAEANTGIVFRRVDLYQKPEIMASIENIGELVRCTTISNGHITIHTIEHLLSALSGLGVDNVIAELNASEPPIMDGSAKFFVNLILQAEPVVLDEDREFIELQEPISITNGNRSIIALPYDGFKITCTSADDRCVYTQHMSIEINPEIYMSEIAPSRTFVMYDDIADLIKLGKIKGGNIDSAIIIKGNQLISKEPLRFKDEFVRHKILDIVGDLALLGKPIKAHIIAVRTGHALNAELTKAIMVNVSKRGSAKKTEKKTPAGPLAMHETQLDIQNILNLLPHRYPFVMVDRVVEFISEDELRAIKNVTINEQYFQGHFPGQPVMPGVMQLESMAQAAGIMMMRKANVANKIAYFMSCDRVKFRRAVMPGDQLEIHVKLVKSRGERIAVADCECKVDGKVVSSAELMFTIMDGQE